MTAVNDTLLSTLEHCDMVEIDGLHAFDFSLDENDNLHIECMDGRAAKRWQFSMAQVNAARYFTLKYAEAYAMSAKLAACDSGKP